MTLFSNLITFDGANLEASYNPFGPFEAKNVSSTGGGGRPSAFRHVPGSKV